MITAKNIALGTRLLPMSFEVSAGEIVHLLGPNGSGKSTLLELLSGLVEGQGNVCIDGVDIQDIDSQSLLANARISVSSKSRHLLSVYTNTSH